MSSNVINRIHANPEENKFLDIYPGATFNAKPYTYGTASVRETPYITYLNEDGTAPGGLRTSMSRSYDTFTSGVIVMSTPVDLTGYDRVVIGYNYQNYTKTSTEKIDFYITSESTIFADVPDSPLSSDAIIISPPDRTGECVFKPASGTFSGKYYIGAALLCNTSSGVGITISGITAYSKKTKVKSLYAFANGKAYDKAYWGVLRTYSSHTDLVTYGTKTITTTCPGSGYRWEVMCPFALFTDRTLSKLYLDAEIMQTVETTDRHGLKFGVSSRHDNEISDSTYCVKYKSVNAVAPRQVYELDISGITSGYVFVGGVGVMTIYNFWAEK